MKGQTIPERMLELLSDGKPHAATELHAICSPSSRGAVSFHIAKIRRELIGERELVLCVLHNAAIHYQLVTKYSSDMSEVS